MWRCDLDLGQWSYVADHVVNPSTKFEDPTAICSWVMSSDISHRIPLTICLQPLCMHCITSPWIRANFSHIFEIPDPDLPIHYTTFMALWWRLRAIYREHIQCKAVFRRKFLSTFEIGPQNGGFWEKRGVNVTFWFCDPEKAPTCVKPRLLTYFVSTSTVASWLQVRGRIQKIAE